MLAKHLGVPTSPWVLPTEAEAVSYNLAIAQEVEGLGVDEIQFDYIRFPDDGPIGPDYSARCRAVEAFLSKAKSLSFRAHFRGCVREGDVALECPEDRPHRAAS